MKLDEENVLRSLTTAIAPFQAIEGVPLSVDVTEAILKTGSGTSQRWFQIALHDVTPNKFLSRDEQIAKYDINETWWMVSSPKRTAFVRAKSRGKAMKDFNVKFPGETADDCELSRGFDFVDLVPEPEAVVRPIDPVAVSEDTLAERRRCAALCRKRAERLQATAEKYPAGTAACFAEEARECERQISLDVPGEAPALLVNLEDLVRKNQVPAQDDLGSGYDYPNPLRPDELYFGITEDDVNGEAFVVLCPKDYWDKNQCMYDGEIVLADHSVDYLDDCPDTEMTWVIPTVTDLDVEKARLIEIGYVHLPELEGGP